MAATDTLPRLANVRFVFCVEIRVFSQDKLRVLQSIKYNTSE
jgi:hypothetical protein